MRNKVTIVVLVAGLLSTLAFTAYSYSTPEPESASAAEPSVAGGPVDGAGARTLIAEDHAVLVDVRTQGEFATGHVEGAINIPVQELDGRLAELSQDTPVIVYCLSGGRSAMAARALREAGYTAHDLGPMSAWGG